ncbi:MAG: DAK2 domain-containing protein, partial [Actinomycetota bacterium]
MEINLKQFKNIMLAMSQAIKDNVSYLTELDARIGDGDHGVNMDKGFRRIARKVEQTEAQDIGQILIESGKVLLNEIG